MVIILKKAIIISILSVLVVLLLFATKVINIQHMEATDDNADSYSDISAYIYVFCGLILIGIAIWTYKIHIVAGIIPIGIGFGSLVYGIYILYAKGILCIS